MAEAEAEDSSRWQKQKQKIRVARRETTCRPDDVDEEAPAPDDVDEDAGGRSRVRVRTPMAEEAEDSSCTASEACSAEAARATAARELEPPGSEICSAEAIETSSELEPKRRHRVSRRLIVRARKARLAERRTLRSGGASQALVEDAGGGAAWNPVEDPSGFDMPFTTTAAAVSGTPPTRSRTAGMSNTVRISDTFGQGNVGLKTAQDLSRFGEIARIDFSLAGTHGTVLVTYFDVRCAQTVMLSMASRAAPFPQASHDCRIVLVDVPGFCEKTGHIGGFQYFGEVANVDIVAGQSVVEFYDIRSAQALLAAAGDCATPVPGSAFVPSAIQTRDLLEDVVAKLPAPPGLGRPVEAPAKAGPKGNCGIPDSASEQAIGVTKDRMAQTRITDKDFQKFDINPDAILRGEDRRTTVMVRHLHHKGLCSSKDVLLFLERCGLGNRYSFFYMPCKEHSNMPAGFAFLNFASPHDVHTLYDAVRSGLWREAGGKAPARPPAVSYARCQGHEHLVRHFSVSAVLQAGQAGQDPERRPLFRPEVLSRPNGVSDPTKAPRIPGPPGLADDGAEVPNHDAVPGPAPQRGASAVPPSRQLQDLLRESARGETQEAAKEEHNYEEGPPSEVGRRGNVSAGAGAPSSGPRRAARPALIPCRGTPPPPSPTRGPPPPSEEQFAALQAHEFAALQDERGPKDRSVAEIPRSLKKANDTVSYVGGREFDPVYSRFVGN